MRIDGRADHIEDYLVTVRTGQWFGFSDPSNKIYYQYLENEEITIDEEDDEDE